MDNATAMPDAQETISGIEPPLYQLSTVTEFNNTEIALAEFRQQYQDLVFNVATPAGLEEAKKARRFLVTCRTGLDKRRKELKADIIARGKLIDGEAGRITGQIEGLELPIDAQIKKREAEQEEIRQAKLQAEAQRQAAIHQKIEALRNHGGTVTTSLGELQRILARLQATDITQDEFEEHAPMAELTKQATIAQVQALIDERARFDAEQAEAKRQQEEAKRQQDAENARLAAEKQAQAETAARLAKAQEELDRKTKEFDDKKAAAEKAARDEEDRVAALQILNAEPKVVVPDVLNHDLGAGSVTWDMAANAEKNEAASRAMNVVAQLPVDDSDDLPWGQPEAAPAVNSDTTHITEEETIISGLMAIIRELSICIEPDKMPEYQAAAAYMARVKL